MRAGSLRPDARGRRRFNDLILSLTVGKREEEEEEEEGKDEISITGRER